MAKGDRKRRKTFFKKGNNLSYFKGSKWSTKRKVTESVRYVRLTSEEQSLVDDNPIEVAAYPGEGGSNNHGSGFRFLRPKKEESARLSTAQLRSEIQRAESGSYRVFHCGKLWEMFNEVTQQHLSSHAQCTGRLDFDYTREQQRGLCWRESVFCNACSYVSKIYNLYEEVETSGRGRRMATANVGLNIAMTQTPVGATSVRKLLLGSSIPAPNRSCMQKAAKKVNTLIEEVNTDDMKQRRKQLKFINKVRGKPENEIAIQADGMYNNSLWSGVTRTPYQPATQMAYLVAENVTGKHQIINLELVNKICSKHGYHTQEGEECDVKSGQCSATACIETSIGDEQRWAKLSLEGLLEDGLTVKYITTDQDTAAYMAATKLFEENKTMTEPVHQVDLRHLSASHRKQMKNCADVLAMMPGKTVQYRQYLQNRFSTDMSKRCYAEFQAIHRQSGGDFSKVTEKINLAINAIKMCYTADHSRCKQYSAVCNGEKENNWICKSAYLNKNFRINLNEQNEETLIQCIEYRLGSDILPKTKLNTNSQKCEASNRCIRRSLPKNTTFGRNFPGRAHSAVHSLNNGPGESLRKLCYSAGCPAPCGSKVSLALLKEQRHSEIQKKRARSILYKAKRIRKTGELYKLYEKDQEKNKYIRSKLVRELKKAKSVKAKKTKSRQISRPSTSSQDHAYTRHKTTSPLKKRQGECKSFQREFIKCLQNNKEDNSKCRKQSMDYLACRMDKNLMERDTWVKLGYADLEKEKT